MSPRKTEIPDKTHLKKVALKTFRICEEKQVRIQKAGCQQPGHGHKNHQIKETRQKSKSEIL